MQEEPPPRRGHAKPSASLLGNFQFASEDHATIAAYSPWT
jgi:hypothetical protein